MNIIHSEENGLCPNKGKYAPLLVFLPKAQLYFFSFSFVFLRSGCDVGGVSGTIGFTVGQKLDENLETAEIHSCTTRSLAATHLLDFNFPTYFEIKTMSVKSKNFDKCQQQNLL